MRISGGFSKSALAAVLITCGALAQDDADLAMLSMETTATTKEEPRVTAVYGLSAETTKKEPRVTAVYGLSADDYLPTTESARNRLRPQVRGPASRPAFDMPDAFYFIGGPIFLLLFLRVLVIFLNGFEEKRKEELRAIAREVPDFD